MNESRIKAMLMGAIAGEALGLPFEGLSKAHIHAVFKSIDNYTDAGPALKGREGNWKKPGLYGYLSQMIILTTVFLLTEKNFTKNGFESYIRDIPETEGEFGIFRHPGSMFANYFQRIKGVRKSTDPIFSRPAAETVILAIPFSFYNNNANTFSNDVISFSRGFTADVDSTAGALIFASFLRNILSEEIIPHKDNLITRLIEILSGLYKDLISNPARIFDLGMNPDNLTNSVSEYLNIFNKIKDMNIAEAEKEICASINKKIKTPITRATVNYPMAMLPYAASYVSSRKDDLQNMFFQAAEEGGSSSVFCSLIGALGAALYCSDMDDTVHKNLILDLVNRKRVMSIVEEMSSMRISGGLLQDFIKSEASLSAKENEERNAKLKHIKIKTKKKKSRRDIERELSSHVVESWTKLDRAKWRKKIDKERIRDQG